MQDPSDALKAIDPLGPVFGVVGDPAPTHVVRIVRPDDLVVITVCCYGLDLVKVGGKALLAPTRENAFLVVGYTFQHMGEQAFTRTATDQPVTPVRVLVAEPSRLAFDVPAAEIIEYSTAGILAALSRLPLRVVPLATPRSVPRRVGGLSSVLQLPGGLQLAHSNLGLVLADQRPSSASSQRPTVDTLLADAHALRLARGLLANQGALDLTESTSATRTDLGGLVVGQVQPPRPVRQKPRAPKYDETAIEAPWRLIISPSSQGAFTHAVEPRAAEADAERIELWHSRLGVRQVADDGTVTVDETTTSQRIVRGVWARDKEPQLAPEPSQTPDPPTPFRMSMDGLDRVMIVRESADPTITTPAPVDATRLYLSSQGAWLDLHGAWDVKAYIDAHVGQTLESWDHVAPMGRDQHVKLSYPGYLFPFGHRASLIKLTERRIDAGPSAVAWLYQRFFIVVREPVRTFNSLDMPFLQVRIRPLVTPDLWPEDTVASPGVIQPKQLFWPIPLNTPNKFEFTLDCLDHDGRRVLLTAPLLFVGDSMGQSVASRGKVVTEYRKPDAGQPAPRGIPARAQTIGLAQSGKPGDTSFETTTLRFTGDPGVGSDLHSVPHLDGAVIVIPAMKRLAPQAPDADVHFAQAYLDAGFGGANATPQVFLELKTMTPMQFGQAGGGSTEKSGGFLQPDIPVRGLSRTLGTVGQVDSLVNPPAGQQPFDPKTFLDGVLPKLFGLFSLVDILDSVGLDFAPKFLTEALGDVASMLNDLQGVQQALTDGLPQLAQDAANAATAPLRQFAADAQTALQNVQDDFVPPLTALTDAVAAFAASGDDTTFTTAASNALDKLAKAVNDLGGQVAVLHLPPVLKARLERLVGALAPLGKLAGQAAQILERIEQVISFVKGLDPEKLSVTASFEWRPKLTNFPAGTDEDDALFFVDPDGLLLSIEARASGKDGVGVDVLAELKHFGLNLFPGASLIKITIDRLSFRSSNGRKPEVDVVMNDMAWQGILSFIAALEELIPADGFSDPPYVDVSPSGVKAGFDLALPSIAVGVFSLENMSLGADVSVPFLGEAVTVGFNFCTRDKPFRLTVMCVGGGGFVGLRISPKGIVLLEMSLEACAQLAIDLGVASGSVSISVGVYLRLEAEKGSLTGYFRIRGEVDVLGIISASITLELSLTYEFSSGKLVGKASVDIEVSVFMFSFSVSVSCERRLAGSNNDPTFAEVLGIQPDGTVPIPGAADGGVPAWSQYCAAFAEV
ncbi:MAG: hypothetical protein ABI345_11005 [Jatrophihabitans sp.]